MNLLEVLKETISALKASKIRTFLTMLGIIIGIASVITMWSIGSGGKESIIGDLQKMGYGKYAVSVDMSSPEFKQKYLFHKDDIKHLKEDLPIKDADVDLLSYVMVNANNSKKTTGAVSAITPATYDMSNIRIVEGRKFLPFEFEENNNVIVIDNVSAKEYFGSSKNALGQYINIYTRKSMTPMKFKIVGVYKSPVETLMKVFSQGELFVMIGMPYNEYKLNFNRDNDELESITIEVNNPDKLTSMMKQTVDYFENKKGVKGIYKVKPASQELDSFDKMLSTLSLFITLAAGISLFVGGIGVMNIMLVTVIERTKEIGIRKAIGATNRDIMLQFLYESVILTALGGILGMIIGMLLSLLIGKIVGITPIFSISSIIISVGISAIIGVIFGVSPARKAAKLNPIDALRTE